MGGGGSDVKDPARVYVLRKFNGLQGMARRAGLKVLRRSMSLALRKLRMGLKTAGFITYINTHAWVRT